MTSGFQFVVRADDEDRVVWLMGSGGLLGNSMLYVEEWAPEKMKRAKDFLLTQARRELEQHGCVREWLGDDLPPSQRIVEIEVHEIVDCVVVHE